MVSLYPTHPECLIVIFDSTHPDGPAALHKQRAALAGYTSVEILDESCVALVVYPGWAARAAA